MPSTYLMVKTLVLSALGRDDSVTQAYVEKGLNYGVLSAALLFFPPELDLIETVSLTSGSSSADISSITGIRSIKSLYNSSASKKIWIMTKDKFDVLTGDLTGDVEFATRHGNYLFFSPTPTATISIQMLHNKYPSEETNMSKELPFDNLDHFVVSEATAFSFACLEESDSAKNFTEIATKLIQVHGIDKQTKDELEVALKSGYNL